MIPPAGRDVQCSNCELVWFQAGAAASADLPQAFVPVTPPTRKKLGDDALAVIASEVDFETKAREQDAAPSNRPQTEPVATQPPPSPPVQSEEDRNSGRFQDVEEINSALPDAPAVSQTNADVAPVIISPEQRRARGFRSGFGLTLIASAALLMAYANAPLIAQRAPHLTSGLASYVRSVDTVRVWLDSTALSMTDRMGAIVEEVSTDG